MKQKILIVDDDAVSVKIASLSLISSGYEVQSVSSGIEALDILEVWQPNLIVLDVNMPDFNGLDTLKVIRKSADYVAVLFVSGRSLVDDIVEGLDAGGDDYLIKPYDVRELLARVRSQLRIKDLRDELRIANSKLNQLVDLDDLTGLFNMRSIYGRIENEIDRSGRYERTVSAIMLDMDEFKSVNDKHDHLFGSFVLKEVGKIINEQIRKVDFAARYGGDEFLIVLSESEKNGVRIFCERLREAIEKKEFVSGPHSMFLTASLGVAVCGSKEAVIDAKELVRRADEALYVSKANGKNCLYRYDFLEKRCVPFDE